MKKQYILTEKEVEKALERFKELKMNAMLCRDAMDMNSNREFYLRAKGFEDALKTLGIIAGA